MDIRRSTSTNKRASLTTKAAKPVNYPNVVSAITEGKALTLDVLQLAVATRPPAISAGKPFDAIVLLQNAANIDVDAVIRLLLPESDLAGKSGRFTTKLTRPIRIGLRPAEVGCTNMPIISHPQTAPGNGYKLQVEIQVEQKQRGAGRVRDQNGGVTLDWGTLSEQRQADLKAMQGLNYSITTAGKVSSNKAILTATFEILPATIAELPQELKPAYITLWTIADSPDDEMLAEKVAPLVAVVLPQLNRTNVFIPLLKATQPWFEKAGFRLWAGEATAISKILTMILEMGVPKSDGTTPVAYPRWYSKLLRVLVQNQNAVSNIPQLVADSLYLDLVYDAAIYGFSMLNTVTNEAFGTAEEMAVYADGLVASLAGKGTPLDLTHVYLPLVLAGLVANTRVTMPMEQVRDTLGLIESAREKRTSQQDSDNQFVFAMLDDLIQRALEHF